MPTVFFSWQADTPTREGRNFIERALERATSRISADTTVEDAVRELAVDRDTKGIPGSPPIVETIFQKIDDAAVFVPDLTFVGKRRDGRPTPNPNVLIEYGWALKTLKHARIVPVMNTAFGQPTADDMPFDLRHLRNPITYSCNDTATDDERKVANAALSKSLEAAIRAVLSSADFKDTLPAQPEFKARVPVDGRGRFAPADQVIAYTGGGIWGKPEPLRVSDKPLLWFRLMPTAELERAFTVDQLESAIKKPPLLQPFGNWHGFSFFRNHESYGTYAVLADNLRTMSAATVAFTSGEIWSVESYYLEGYRDGSGQPTIPQIDQEFYKALTEYSAFLERLEIKPPYRWIVGMEALSGRALYVPAPPGRSRGGYGPDGTCAVDYITQTGLYAPGEDPARALRPFFEDIYNACGVPRRDWQDR